RLRRESPYESNGMTRIELIGEVGRLYLVKALGMVDSCDDAEGTARFILDQLTADQAGAIARAILVDPVLAAQFEIKLPVNFMAGQGLPDSALTNDSITHHRHAECSKPAMLLPSTSDYEEASLRLVT